MTNIGEVIGWKFNHQSGMSTRDGIITEFPGGIPSQADQDKWTKEWNDEAPTREMEEIRNYRNVLLTETDWMANSDVTMSDAWKTYRQDLRDIPASNTVYENVSWPTKPE